MSLDIRIGDDKQPAPVVPANVPLYNLQTGKVLTDEGGTPLVSESDVVLSSEAVSDKSTSVVFTKDKPSNKISNFDLTGKNFQALNGSVYQVELLTPGNGFLTDGQVTITAGSFNGLLNYKANPETTGISELSVTFGGDGYAVDGTIFAIVSGGIGAVNATFKISVVSTQISGDSARFETELEAGNTIKLPTGFEDGAPSYESRKVFEVRSDNVCFVSTPVTIQKKKTAAGVGFGKLTRVGFLKINPVLPITEQFAEFTAVSTSILGVPKAETQLSLFSNVSSYGLDTDSFLFYTRDNYNSDPFEWATRRNREYGDHYNSGYLEETGESAIVVRSYKTPYTFPYGPGVNSQGYPYEAQITFCNFLKMGCLMYDWFKGGGLGYINYELSDEAYAGNFVPYYANHFTVEGTIVGELISVTRPSPYYDLNGNLVTPFLNGESIYYYRDWNLATNQPNSGATPIGTLLDYRFYAGVQGSADVLHFEEEVGFLWTEEGEDFVVIGATSKSRTTIVSDMTFNKPDFFFAAMLGPLNPAYRNNRDFFNQIDTWTETWRNIKKGIFKLPSGGPLDADFINANAYIQTYITDALGLAGDDRNVFTNSLPGYSSSTGRQTRAYLVSRKAFRYQPGRISGYTFGVRASGDASTNAVRIEWGIGNDTDELMFQISGANLSIVRRSVVPLSDSVMDGNNLDPGNPASKGARERSLPDAQYWDGDQKPITLDTQNNNDFLGLPNRQAFEVVIPRDNWNGDALNGNGPSEWNWVAENVTMYKIEFGWYGAIGVKFYAYVPVSNNESRWVRLHTLVIENQLNRPCMGDPYYKFKYALLIDDMEEVRSPQYVYKYGTSCYIDGGDQGTIKVGAITSEPKVAPVELAGGINQSTTVVGLIPKTVIYNAVGEAVKNKQQIFPREISLQANGLTEIALVKCTACPGYGHTYQGNLSSSYSGDLRFFVNPQNISGGYDRSILELPVLKRRANFASGSNIITILGSALGDPSSADITAQSGGPISFFRVGDIVNPRENFGNQLFDGGSPPYITAINPITNQITVSKSITAGTFTNYSLEIQPLFVGFKDEYSKVISNRIWGTYIGSRLDFSGTLFNTIVDGVTTTGRTFSKMVRVDTAAAGGTQLAEAFRYFIPRTLQTFRRSGVSVIPTDTEFPARLSQYDAVAGSSLPIVGKENSVLFLLPDAYGSPDRGIYGGGQYADWRIGITNLRPTQPGGANGSVVWTRKDGTPVPEFTTDYKLFAERFAEGILNDLEGFEVGETDNGRVPAFTVDYRIPPPPGSNTGNCSYIKINVNDAQYASATQVSGNNLPNLTQAFLNQLGPEFPFSNLSTTWYLKFSGAPPFDYDPSGAEIGFNASNPNPLDPSDPNVIPNTGSGIRFTTNFVSFDETLPDGSTITSYVSKVSGKPLSGSASGTSFTIYYIPVSLETFRKLATKSFDYNPFPLFFFIEMRDGCRINGPVIKEVTQVDNVYNPKWLVSPSMVLDNANIQVGPIGATGITTGDLESAPPNFTSPQRLSSALIDTQSTSQLRPYDIIDKIYVGNETTTIDLSAVFGSQKVTITHDLLNTTAYFFIATSKEPSSTEISGTLNYIEQQ
jgi:hypothetical protein